MIVVFTPVHGAYDTAIQTIRAVDAIMPSFYIHLIGDDFSPGHDVQKYEQLEGTIQKGNEVVGERIVYPCSSLGLDITESPNMGLSLRHAFDIARDLHAEALLTIESDVIPRPGIVNAFRNADHLYGDNCGVVTPLFTKVGENVISSFGGMSAGKAGGEDDFLDLRIGMDVGSWGKTEKPRLDSIWWTHLACLWIPRRTLMIKNDSNEYVVNPDPNFSLWYCDHDLSYTIVNVAKKHIVITDHAVAEHSRECASTQLRWPVEEERQAIELQGRQQLYDKWNI